MSQLLHPTNPAYLLDDGTATYAPSGGGQQTGYGQVGGSARVYDMGAGVTTPAGWLAQFETDVLNLSGGSQSYYLTIQGSTTSTFTTFEELARWQVTTTGQADLVAFSTLSKVSPTVYRYVRLAKIVNGTNPQIRSYCFLAPLNSLTQYTLSELVQIQSFLAQNQANAASQFQTWMAGTATGGPNGDGTYPLTDGYGNTTYQKCPARMYADAMPTSPFQYGAVGSQGLPWGTWPSRPAKNYFATLSACQAVYPFATSLEQEMDFLGWQAALNTGRRIQVDGRYHFKMCNSHPDSYATPLVAVSGISYGSGGYSEMHWEDMREIVDSTEYLSDASFAISGASSPWKNATAFSPTQMMQTVFGGGQALCQDNNTDPITQGRFWSFGQQITIQPGRWSLSCTLTATLGASYGPPINNSQPSYASISIFTNGPGQGGNPFGRSASFDVQAGIFAGGITQTRNFDIYCTTPTTCWVVFQGGGYVNFQITNFSMKKWLPNCAWLLTRDGSPHHYPVPMPISDLYQWGPDKTYTGTKCFQWKSFSNMDGNLCRIENIMMQGFGTQIDVGDGGYLLELRNVGGGSANICVNTQTGTYNAGENLRFYGGGFGNSNECIRNEGGMEITFYGSSADYSTQTVTRNRGRVEFFGVHLETLVPTDVNKPMIENYESGVFRMIGGMVLGAGGINTSPCAPLSTQTTLSYVDFDGTELYNLTSSPTGAGAGAIMSGPGQMRTPGGWRNKGNPNMGPTVVSYALSMDILGGAGRAETVTDTPVFNGMGLDPSGMRLMGGSYFVPSAPSTDLIISQWNTSRLQLSVSTDYAKSGTRSIKVQKKAPYGVGDGCRAVFLVPIKEFQAVLGTISFLFPNAIAGATAGQTATMYFRYFWFEQVGTDSYGRPIFSDRNVFLGEDDLAVPLDGSAPTTWYSRKITTVYLGSGSTNAALGNANGAPKWATHLAVLLDHESLPALTYYIDDMIVTPF